MKKLEIIQALDNASMNPDRKIRFSGDKPHGDPSITIRDLSSLIETVSGSSDINNSSISLKTWFCLGDVLFSEKHKIKSLKFSDGEINMNLENSGLDLNTEIGANVVCDSVGVECSGE